MTLTSKDSEWRHWNLLASIIPRVVLILRQYEHQDSLPSDKNGAGKAENGHKSKVALSVVRVLTLRIDLY